MQARPSHSALDELLDFPFLHEEQTSKPDAEGISKAAEGDHDLHTFEQRGEPFSVPRAAAESWLPAPDSSCVSQQDEHITPLRLRAWPCPASSVTWVGIPPAAEVCPAATSDEQNHICVAAAFAVPAALGKKPKAAPRPCYQAVMKVRPCGIFTFRMLWHSLCASQHRGLSATGLHVSSSVFQRTMRETPKLRLSARLRSRHAAHTGQDCGSRRSAGGHASAHGCPACVQCGSTGTQFGAGVPFSAV